MNTISTENIRRMTTRNTSACLYILCLQILSAVSYVQRYILGIANIWYKSTKLRATEIQKFHPYNPIFATKIKKWIWNLEKRYQILLLSNQTYIQKSAEICTSSSFLFGTEIVTNLGETLLYS